MAAPRHVNGQAPVKLLFVLPAMMPSNVGDALLQLLRSLDRARWCPTIAVPQRGSFEQIFEQEQIATLIHDPDLFKRELSVLYKIAPQFDLVMANTTASWLAVEIAHAGNVPVIWYLHETPDPASFPGLADEIYRAMNLADVIVVPSTSVKRVLDGVTRTAVQLVQYGIQEPAAATQGEADHLRFVVFGGSGAGDEESLFGNAVKQLSVPECEKCSFTFIARLAESGGGERIPHEPHSGSEVRVIDGCERDVARKLIRSANVVIFAAFDHSMLFLLLEAMSLGKTLVSSEFGLVTEWVHDGLNALLISSPKALAEAIRNLVKDQRSIRQLGASAFCTFDRYFRVEQFVAAFSELLERTLQGGQRVPEPNSYERWVAQYDTPNLRTRVVLKRQVRALRTQPLISIILPVYNPEIAVLLATIDSVKGQTYERWELCVADDASTNPEVRHVLEQLARDEPRAKVIFRSRNGHISACSNTALALATGTWCALLDHDDALSEDALAQVAIEISRHPEAGLFYSDQDSIDRADRRSNPFFKTEWDPLLFLGQNFVNHLGVYRTSLMREIDGFREGFEGSQDYDLVLRCIERLSPEQIRHIPRILYHWRSVPGSVAECSGAKPYATGAARRAIADYLTRSGTAGRVEACPEHDEFHRVVFEISDPEPFVSVVIVARDKPASLERCVRSVCGQTHYQNLEICLVDNGSVEPETHRLFERLKQSNRVRVLCDAGPFNLSKLDNVGAAGARGELIVFLSDDVEATTPGWLREMVSHATRSEVGAVGARLWLPNDTIQHAGLILGLGGLAGPAYHGVPRGHAGYFNRAWLHHHSSAVTAACLLMKTKLFHELGGFNEEKLPVLFNDLDLCLRIRAQGLKIVWTPYAELIHHGSISSGDVRPPHLGRLPVEAEYAQDKWGIELLNDPYYSPNLSLALPGFELAFPPRGLAHQETNASSPVPHR